MNSDYLEMIWEGFDESFIIKILERTYRKLDYSTTNFHENERVHEEGIDLLCEKDSEKIAIQVKIKPRKKDIKQFNQFLKSANDKKMVYVYVKSPTKFFKEFIESKKSDVEFWDTNKLHEFLIRNESIDYCCLFFSKHPLILSLLNAHKLIVQKRQTKYVKRKYTNEEITKLWAAKDNIVKIWAPLHFIYLKWNKILMSKIEKDESEFDDILNMIWEDLRIVYRIAGEKFVSSIEDLSEKYPDLIGLMWKLISQRTGWIEYTVYVDKCSLEESLFFTLYYWICPLFNESKRANMCGFYSCMNYLLENFQRVAKDLEFAIDCVFEALTEVDHLLT